MANTGNDNPFGRNSTMTVKRFTEGNKPKEANLKKKSTINLKQFQFIDVDQA